MLPMAPFASTYPDPHFNDRMAAFDAESRRLCRFLTGCCVALAALPVGFTAFLLAAVG